MKKQRCKLVGTLIGVVFTPLALWTAFASAGAGHGSYFLAKLLFPYSMLLTRTAGDTITTPLIGLALVQFPLYGWLVASFSPTRTAGALLVLHAISVGLCFSGILPSFS